jgi:hypothetical protein
MIDEGQGPETKSGPRMERNRSQVKCTRGAAKPAAVLSFADRELRVTGFGSLRTPPVSLFSGVVSEKAGA